MKQRMAMTESESGRMTGRWHELEVMMRRIESKFTEHEVTMDNFALRVAEWESKMEAWAKTVEQWTGAADGNVKTVMEGLAKLREDATEESRWTRLEMSKLTVELDTKATTEDGFAEKRSSGFGGKMTGLLTFKDMQQEPFSGKEEDWKK